MRIQLLLNLRTIDFGRFMNKTKQTILQSGIDGLDEILNGGFPQNRLYLMQGEPGTGKTTLAFQYLLKGISLGEKCLYISFSESKEELDAVAASHNWNISKLHMLELGSIEEQLKPEAQNTVFYPSEVEMNQTMNVLYTEIERIKPDRIVFDSISEMRMLADDSLRYRRQMLALKQFFARQNCTVLLLDDLTTSPKDLQVQSIVHGVLNLQKLHPEFGTERRRLNVVKLRGIDFLGGFHDYVIKQGGVVVFPRMISATHENQIMERSFSSGIKELDNLLGGGLDSGTSTLFLGPAGTGKSTLSIQYAYAAVERGEKALLLAFEESISTLLKRTSSIGMNLQKHIDSGSLKILKIDPAQLSPGEFTDIIRLAVLNENFKLVCIDSLNGYLHAMPQEQFLTLQLHELLSFLSNQGVATLMVLAQQGVMGQMMNTPIDLTYLADTVVITRYFEIQGSVRKAVSVIKQRSGAHETTIRELTFTPKGLTVGKPLTELRGVLTGVPEMLTAMGNKDA
jgi:circadian clock protein KaiC